jgi:competence protein ComEC
MKAIQNAPVFKLSLACGGGIFLAAHVSLASAWLLLPALLGLLWLLLRDRQWLGQRSEQATVICIMLGMLGLGALRYGASHTQPTQGQPLEAINCQEVLLLGEVVAPVKANPWGRKAQVRVLAVRQDSQWLAVQGGLLLYLPTDLTVPVQQFDTLCFRGDLRTVYSQYQGYLEYLQQQGVGHSLRAEQVQVGQPAGGIAAWAYRWQQRAAHSLGLVIGDSSVLGLAEAMFLGEKRHLRQSQREDFAAAGASHILAISGLHVGLIFTLLHLLLTPLLRLPHGERIRSGSILLCLLCYLMLTGAAPAVSRATLMLSLMLLLRMCYQRFDRLNLVAMAALIQMMVDPAVIFAVGFQLSYAAVLGIVLMMPAFERAFEAQQGWLGKLYGLIGVSLVATLATAPLVIFYFGQFPTYFLLTNLLISLFATVLVMVGFLTVVLSACPVIGSLLGEASTRLLQLLDLICSGIADLPYAVIDEVSWHEKGFPLLGLQLLLTLLLLTGPQWWARLQRLRGHAAIAQA